MQHNFDLLAKIVAETKGPPNWSFRLIDQEGAKRLVIRICGYDNYAPEETWEVDHYHPCPVAVYNEASWRRWIFDQALRTMNHELGEQIRFGPREERPFAPLHGPGEDPYTVHEFRPERDALTTQDGSLRERPI